MKKSILLFSAVILMNIGYTQTWETLESMPSSAAERHHPAAFSVGGTGYVMGGAESNSNALGDFYSYDPLADAWTTKTDFPGQPRGFGYAVSSDTKGYVGFGYDYDAGTGDEAYLKDLWEYDPLTDNWTQLAECPGSARVHPAMVYLDGKIYMGCGGNIIGDVDDWWEYDIDSDTWTAKTDFPGDARHHPYYFALDGYVYVGMGHSGPNIYNDFYRYDPNTDTWTQMGDLPDQGRVAGTQFTYDGKGYFLSGQGENHQNLPTGEFWVYEPGTDSWTELTAHPGGGRWAPGSFVINGGVYLLCGESNSGVEKDMMRYQIEGFASLDVEVEKDELLVFPNPSTGEIKISGIKTSAELTLVDINGKNVWTGKITAQESIDLSFLDAGIYFCNVLEEGVLRRERLILE